MRENSFSELNGDCIVTTNQQCWVGRQQRRQLHVEMAVGYDVILPLFDILEEKDPCFHQ